MCDFDGTNAVFSEGRQPLRVRSLGWNAEQSQLAVGHVTGKVTTSIAIAESGGTSFERPNGRRSGCLCSRGDANVETPLHSAARFARSNLGKRQRQPRRSEEYLREPTRDLWRHREILPLHLRNEHQSRHGRRNADRTAGARNASSRYSTSAPGRIDHGDATRQALHRCAAEYAIVEQTTLAVTTSTRSGRFPWPIPWPIIPWSWLRSIGFG